MNRDQARAYVGHCVDDSLCIRRIDEIPDPDDNVTYVGWQAGAEPMFVAVWSYLGHRLDGDEAEDLAMDLLEEKGWFAGHATFADYIL